MPDTANLQQWLKNMQNSSDEQIAINTWNVCRSRLSPTLVGKLEPYKADPKRLRKYGGHLDIMRLRILPVRLERIPSDFWDPEWCLYELGVGLYPHQTLCLAVTMQ